MWKSASDREAIAPMVAPSVVRDRDGRNRTMRSAYVHPDLGDDPQYDEFATADIDLMNKCGRFIADHYINHHFVVDVSNARGFIKVYIPELMGAVNGFVIPLQYIANHFEFERLMHRACGEILERYRIPRAGFSRDEFRAALAKVPIGPLHNAIVPE